jgi:hypothetical protein
MQALEGKITAAAIRFRPFRQYYFVYLIERFHAASKYDRIRFKLNSVDDLRPIAALFVPNSSTRKREPRANRSQGRQSFCRAI